MSSSSKGAELERRAKAALERQGFLVHRAVRTPYIAGSGRYGSNSNDVFGVADLVALKLGNPVRFVQCTVPTHRAAKRKKVEPVARRADPESASFEVWTFVGGRRDAGGQRFRVDAWNGLEWADCEDQVCLPAATAGSRVARASKLHQPGAREQKDIGRSASSRPEVRHG